ncbi:hypothetical protein [Achromobacter kerstersii]|uniref:hypothetical protein n=1 Tax=Achromobacter kerstersii TaxID=1353890 RepID=UPI00313AD0AA
MAKTYKERTADVRTARIDANWTELRLWAMTQEDAEHLKNEAERRRVATSEAQVREEGRKRGLPDDRVGRILMAIKAQGAREYTSPAGAILELMSDFAQAQDLEAFAAAYHLYAKVHPGSQRRVLEMAPTKLAAHYFHQHLDAYGALRLVRWQQDHPNWAEAAQHALQTDRLGNWVKHAIDEIRATKLKEYDE